MKNFVDVLDGLKKVPQKDVNRKRNIDQAWKIFRESPGHTLRALKVDIQNAVHKASHELHSILEYAVFSVESYLDEDKIQKISIKIAFVPHVSQESYKAHESLLLNILIDHITALGLNALVNDICVNSLQQRF